MNRAPGYWKNYYATHRAQRLAESKAYGLRTKEARRHYMEDYYKAHPEKWTQSEEQKAKKREARRERYANDPEYRKVVIASSKATRQRNPNTRLKRTLAQYGLSLDEYWDLEKQGCAICGSLASQDKQRSRLHIDHNHQTGAFRGLLCTNCNLAIGQFQDNPELLLRAAHYLQHKEPSC